MAVKRETKRGTDGVLSTKNGRLIDPGLLPGLFQGRRAVVRLGNDGFRKVSEALEGLNADREFKGVILQFPNEFVPEIGEPPLEGLLISDDHYLHLRNSLRGKGIGFFMIVGGKKGMAEKRRGPLEKETRKILEDAVGCEVSHRGTLSLAMLTDAIKKNERLPQLASLGRDGNCTITLGSDRTIKILRAYSKQQFE